MPENYLNRSEVLVKYGRGILYTHWTPDLFNPRLTHPQYQEQGNLVNLVAPLRWEGSIFKIIIISIKVL